MQIDSSFLFLISLKIAPFVNSWFELAINIQAILNTNFKECIRKDRAGPMPVGQEFLSYAFLLERGPTSAMALKVNSTGFES